VGLHTLPLRSRALRTERERWESPAVGLREERTGYGTMRADAALTSSVSSAEQLPQSVRVKSGPHERLVGVDAARVVAIALVVLLHACVGYLERPLAGLLWPVQESPRGGGDTWWVDQMFWIVRILGVPVVTLIAGYFAARAVERSGGGREGGGRKFFRERLRRLGVPLVIATLTVLPLMYVVWGWGWVERGWAAPIHILHIRFGPAVQPNLFGLAHLWYLEYLLIYAGIYALWCTVLPQARLSMRVARLLMAPVVRWIVLGVPLALVLLRWPGVVLEFQNGFLPQAGKFLWNAVFFGAGVVLFRATNGGAGREGFVRWSRWWPLDGLLAIASGFVLVPAAHAMLGRSPEDEAAVRFAICSAVLAVSGGGGLVGACVWLLRTHTSSSRVARALRWLADATFWIYVLHLLFQGIASVLLYKHELAVGLKLVVVFVAGLGGPLVVCAVARRWRIWAWMRPVGERGGSGVRVRSLESSGPGPTTRESQSRPESTPP
jgi:glucans biosynthesis protein C